ncbi:MAG TPA: ABC transporter permease [Thiotrichales bacterium]|nr:ABC transporter permease [Thiotrichales bacterium]
MLKIIQIVAAIVLVLHGLIHLMGTAVYMKLAELEGFSYKTTLLGGRLDLGEGGIRVFGALWVVPAIGFVAVGVALLAGWEWWPPVLVAATLFSLVLTALDWSVAYAGVIVNVLILAIIWIGPRFTGWVFR